MQRIISREIGLTGVILLMSGLALWLFGLTMLALYVGHAVVDGLWKVVMMATQCGPGVGAWLVR